MKRIFALMLGAAMALTLLSACGSPAAENTVIPSDLPGETASVPPDGQHRGAHPGPPHRGAHGRAHP